MMRNRFWMMIVLATGWITFSGCHKGKTSHETVAPATHPAGPVALEPWQKRLQELTTAVKPGMTEDAVTQVAGDPKWTSMTLGGAITSTWSYELGNGDVFLVRFDRNHHVVATEQKGGGNNTQ